MPSVASASDDDVLLQDVDEYFDAGDDASNVTGKHPHGVQLHACHAPGEGSPKNRNANVRLANWDSSDILRRRCTHTGTGSDNASAGADAADEGEFFDAARAIQGGEDSSYLDFPAHA